MPHAALKLIPGVDQNRTPALNEAGISQSNLIRFVPDRNGVALPQKLGGWTKFYDQPMTAVVRALWAWADTNSDRYLGIATEDGLFTLKDAPGQSAINRSPQVYNASPTMSFATTNGLSTVIITDTGSNITSFDSIYLQTPVSIGGIVLFGFYSCTAVTSDSYSILSTNIIGIPRPATATATGGATPVLATTSGSAYVDVTLNNHGYSVGSTFPVLIPTTVGGITLYGNYEVTKVTSANVFSIIAENTAGSTASVSMNAGDPAIVYYIGQSASPVSVGYGAGGYGAGGYGSGVTSTGSRTFTVTNASCVGTTATVTFSGKYQVPIGSTVTITGVTPSGYNSASGVPWVVTANSIGTSTSTISFTVPSTLGAYVSGGSISVIRFAYYEVEDWTLDNWGEYLIAGHKGGDIFYFDPTGGGQYFSVVPNAPIVNEGYFVAMPERQIIAYGSSFTGIQDPLLVRWCDIGNFTSWIGTVVNQAGSFRIPKGSRIVGGMQGPQQGLLWTDLGVWSMQYVNLPLVWSFNEIGTGCGLIGQKACASMNGVIYWMGQSQFYTLSGGGVQTIPCPIWDVIFQDIDTAYAQNIRCAPNSRFGEIAWYYPTTGSNGVPNKYVKFNTQLGVWDYGTLTRTAWIDQSVLGPPIGSGGNNYIFQHETSPDADGQVLAASVQTGYFAISEGDMLTFLDQLWPDMKWGYFGGTQNASVKLTFYVADYPGQTPRIHGPYTVSQASTYVTPRLRGRLVAIRIENDDVGTFWRLGNIRYRMQPDGKF